jgi:cysteine desulfurase/selenocysteine lyase
MPPLRSWEDSHAEPLAADRAIAPEFDLAEVRADFPILGERVRERPLAYLDNAATTHKPRAVLDAIAACWSHSYANVGRGVHALAERATAAHEAARETARRFLNATSSDEVIFVSGTTAALNLVAATHGRRRVGRGDEVVISALEHHSNLLPWQRLCAARGAVLRVAPLTAEGEIDLAAFRALLTPRTRIVAVAHVSNVLGSVSPLREISRLAHACGAVVVVDGAQGAPHRGVDVRALGCDFYAFSAHKVYGPSGIGVLWGKAELLAEMPPYELGGGMVDAVSFESATFAPVPQRFEAGTPAIEGAVGMAAGLEYLERLGREAAERWEQSLLQEAIRRLRVIPGVRLIATPELQAPVLSFVVDGVHAHDVATVLDGEGVAVRAGHHCAQPLMERLRVAATTRVSFAFYNTLEEIDALVGAVVKTQEMLG